jgi:hypothetical protein
MKRLQAQQAAGSGKQAPKRDNYKTQEKDKILEALGQ